MGMGGLAQSLEQHMQMKTFMVAFLLRSLGQKKGESLEGFSSLLAFSRFESVSN
jgi:hypothetical protein